jgi:hypothetical protein
LEKEDASLKRAAELAARFNVEPLATFKEFGRLIRVSARTVARLEVQGLPVLRASKTPLVPVRKALAWISEGKPARRTRGRPRNTERGGVTKRSRDEGDR